MVARAWDGLPCLRSGQLSNRPKFFPHLVYGVFAPRLYRLGCRLGLILASKCQRPVALVLRYKQRVPFHFEVVKALAERGQEGAHFTARRKAGKRLRRFVDECGGGLELSADRTRIAVCSTHCDWLWTYSMMVV